MSLTTTSRRRLAILASACLLGVALPAGTAFAQKTKTKSQPAVEATAPVATTEFNVVIPAIESVDSNVDDATLLAIFSGDLAANADALAGLNATSITIPEITLEATTSVDDDTRETYITFSDLVLTDVIDGAAAEISIAGVTVEGGDEGSAEFGTLSASNFDIAGVLGLYGLVDAGGQTELETIYTDFSFAGGSLEAPEVSCTIGAMNAAEFKARPLNYSLPEIISLAEQLEANPDEPSPELIGDALRMYADLFTAFETSESTFDGFECSGIDDEDRSIAFTVAGMTMGGMRPGFYPSISVDGLDITVEGDGTVKVGNFTMGELDLSGPIAAIQGAPAAIDESWFEDNARALIPAFSGFSFSDIFIDVPDEDNPDARIAASIGEFGLSLSDYINGIPANLLLSASNIVADLPTDSGDPQIDQLVALGIQRVDAGFTVAAAWNEAEDTIAINEVSITGADLATIVLAGTITNATEALFSTDENTALMAAMGLAISNLKLDITDNGLSDIILTVAAAEQGGGDPAAMRPIFAGLAEGTVIGLLAGAAEAQKVGAALNTFISGKAKYLTIEMTAKEAPGLGMMDFMQAEDDPTSLIGKVTIDATAK